jgi:hypothetical protein
MKVVMSMGSFQTKRNYSSEGCHNSIHSIGSERIVANPEVTPIVKLPKATADPSLRSG